MIGYMMFTKDKFKLQTEFIPVFVFSSIACIVFLGGLAKHLFIAGGVVMAAGAVLFVHYMRKFKSRQKTLKLRVSLFHVIFLAGSLFFLYLLSITRLTHYDNFSHWAVVLKDMLLTDAFPTATSALIDFKNYPLGTTSFLYYICRFAGNSQPMMLIAQGILIMSCFYAMFGIIMDKKRFLLYAFLCAGCSSLSIFNITIRINNLLVDFLLPLYTLVLFTMAYRSRSCIKKACIGFIPVAGLLMIIKNTGVIFAGIGFIYLIYLWVKGEEKLHFKSGLIAATATLPYLFWMVHMSVRFQGVTNKFELAAKGLDPVSARKSSEEMGQIISLFVRSAFDLTTRPVLGILIFHLAAIGTTVFAAIVLKKHWSILKTLLALDVVLSAYYLGILSLYLFSMPIDEALVLAGFERYASSIVILFAGSLILCATVDMERSFYYRINEVPDYRAFKSVESKGRYQNGIIVSIGLSMALLFSEYNGMQTIQQTYDTTLPYKVWQVTGDRWDKSGAVSESKYLFYASDTDNQVSNHYLQYLGRYMLYAPNVDGICAFYEDNMTNLLSRYDYLVVVESDLRAKYLLREHYGVTGKQGIYQIYASEGEGQEKKVALSLVE
jgi:hypothetical protein